MILIISNSHDESSTQVIEWLENLGKKWFRVNENELIDLEFLGKEIQFKIDNNTFLLSQIDSVWYRRGFLNFNWANYTIDNNIDRVLQNEKVKIINFIYFLLKEKKNINNYFNAEVNKLIVSKIANDIGIKVTDDYLFSKKDNLCKTLTKSTKFISKTISGDSMLLYKNFTVLNYTKLINFDADYSDQFYPSLVQAYIEKKYELRIFYLAGAFYTMAIFSQKDNQTSIDFRAYNRVKPNRRVPFNLPKSIEYKLDVLMKQLNLNCGSIDMIVTPTNEYVFLEVNPLGQFAAVSYYCNYNLEKHIANYL